MAEVEFTLYEPEQVALLSHYELTAKLQAIYRLAQKHIDKPLAESLANQIVKIVEGR